MPASRPIHGEYETCSSALGTPGPRSAPETRTGCSWIGRRKTAGDCPDFALSSVEGEQNRTAPSPEAVFWTGRSVAAQFQAVLGQLFAHLVEAGHAEVLALQQIVAGPP